jgi:hypothetical protein
MEVNVMKWFCLFILVHALSITPSASANRNSGPEYEAAMKAAMMLMSFDEFYIRCKAEGGPSEKNETTIRTWKQNNNIDAVRFRMQNLRKDANNNQQLNQAVTMLTDAADKSKNDPCELIMRLIATPEAQFAQKFADQPQTASAAPARMPAKKESAIKPSGVSSLLKQIDSFGFDTRMTMGVGGFLTTDIYPVVLFRDGNALTDITGLSDPNGITHNRTANSNDWTRWRRNGGKIELQKSKNWEALPFPRTYASLPTNFRLDGLYRRLSGVGNIAAGGNQSASSAMEYRFWRDGTILRGGTAGAAASTGSSSTVVSSAQPDARGKYRIDGLMLTIAYDNGEKENRLLVADPTDPKTAIWLDGRGYVQRKR